MQPDCERFALAGRGARSDHFCDLFGSGVIFAGKRHGHYQKGAGDSFFKDFLWGGGQDEKEHFCVPGLDDIQGVITGDGWIGGDLIHIEGYLSVPRTWRRVDVGDLSDAVLCR